MMVMVMTVLVKLYFRKSQCAPSLINFKSFPLYLKFCF